MAIVKAMKGIILAGGLGTRLWPMSGGVSKQALPVFDKPMIYYPLTTLIEMRVREVMIISNDVAGFSRMFRTGLGLGMNIEYRFQGRPNGIAEALIIAGDWAGESEVALILGDNLFTRNGPSCSWDPRNALLFGCQVAHPERYGCMGMDKNGRLFEIIEKPKQFSGRYAVTGLYIYPNAQEAAAWAKELKPSARGELEITDLNNRYLKEERLCWLLMEDQSAWFDCGTPESLLDAANFVASHQKRHGRMIGCPEVAAMEAGFISMEELARMVSVMPVCAYRESLESWLGKKEEPAFLA